MKNQDGRAIYVYMMGVIGFAVTLFFPFSGYARISNDPVEAQWSYTDTGVYGAWDSSVGSSAVVVAIIDNGFDSFHPDLAENVWKNDDEIPANGIDDDKNGYVDDVWGWNFAVEDINRDGVFDDSERQGNNDPRPSVFDINRDNQEAEVVHHGTVVAGIIGASGNNGESGSGINWRVKLMNIKIVGNVGTGELNLLPEAIRYAVDNGAHVINMSMVGSVDPLVKEAVKYAFDRGVAVVAAAGNDMMSLDLTERYPICADAGENEEWILGVSAIRQTHQIAQFSNVGAACVDITAPGVNISSAMRYAPSYGFSDKYGGGWSGTSFAAPFVSGAAALVKSIQPAWGAKEIYSALLTTVHKTPPADEQEYARLFGAGLLQIDKAVAYAAETAPAIVEKENPSVALAQDSTPSFPSLFLIRQKSGRFLRMYGFSADPAIMPAQAVAVGSWQDKAISVFVGQRVKDRAAVRVIRTATGKELFSWNIPSVGPVDVHVRDVIGDRAPEVLIAPKNASKDVYIVYSLEGMELARVTSPQTHAGSSIDFGDDGRVFAFFRQGKDVSIYEIKDNSSLVRLFAVPGLYSAGTVRTGDVHSSPGMEIIISGGKGERSDVFVYDRDGSLLAKTPTYGKQYRGEVLLSVGDYNADGSADILTLPAVGGLPLRLWSGTMVKIEEKKVAKDAGGYILLTVK